MKQIWQVGLLSLGFLLAACGTTGQQANVRFANEAMMDESAMGVEDQMAMDDFEALNNGGNARVRVVHLSPDAPNVDILVDNAVASRGLEYTNFIGPVALPAGKRNLKVNAAGTSTSVIDVTPELEAGKRYTALAVNKLASIEPLLLQDTRFASRNAALVRLLHGAPSAPAVDIYVSRPGKDLNQLEPVLKNISFKTASRYFFIRPGDIQVRIVPAGSKTVVIDSGTLNVKATDVFTAVAIDKKGAAGFSAIVINEREVKAPNPPAPKSIVDIASGNPAFSTLVGALQAADLVGALSGTGPFTVFAPTNDAFAKLSSVPGGEALRNVLLYHVANGRLSAADLLRAGEAVTLQGEKVRVRQMGNAVILNDNVMVTTANIQASNGIIHVIDTVLIPPALPSIVEIATGNTNFSTLVSALQSAGLVSALQAAGPFTVFAPTNAAFAKLAALPAGDALRDVLLYHVAAGRFDAASLLRAGEVTTLQGRNIRVEQRGNDVILNGVVRVTTANIAASNGIVHVIDTVLIPPLPSILELAAATPTLSTLVGTVQSAGLVSALSGNGPFTVFAPTNDAFGRLRSVPSGDALRNVLTYHVASGRFTAQQLTDLGRRHGTVRTLQGANIQLSLDHSGNLLLNGNVRVLTANVNASNGIVHVIDRVLIPPSH